MLKIPHNLIRLHDNEEILRESALAAIADDSALKDHLQAVHDAIDHLTLLIRPVSSGTDMETLQLLGIRTLNFTASALKVGLSGYYQVGFSLLREMLEVVNLIDLFIVKPELISVWRTADKQTHNKLFKPVKIRVELAKHPSHSGQDRSLIYQMYSTFASHPNYEGFKLLANVNGKNIGPFFDLSLLRALLEDMGAHASHTALALSMAIEPDDETSIGARVHFLGVLGRYRTTYIKGQG